MAIDFSRATQIPINRINRTAGTQTRDKLDDGACREYAERKKNGEEWPPVKLVYNGVEYFPVDGFHRIQAAILLGDQAILAEIAQGDQKTAVWLSLAQNNNHGVRLTPSERRRKVETALNDEEWRKYPNQAIADHCGVSASTVASIRKTLGFNDPIRVVERTRNGITTKFEQNTAGMRRGSVVETADAESDFDSAFAHTSANIYSPPPEKPQAPQRPYNSGQNHSHTSNNGYSGNSNGYNGNGYNRPQQPQQPAGDPYGGMATWTPPRKLEAVSDLRPTAQPSGQSAYVNHSVALEDAPQYEITIKVNGYEYSVDNLDDMPTEVAQLILNKINFRLA